MPAYLFEYSVQRNFSGERYFFLRSSLSLTLCICLLARLVACCRPRRLTLCLPALGKRATSSFVSLSLSLSSAAARFDCVPAVFHVFFAPLPSTKYCPSLSPLPAPMIRHPGGAALVYVCKYTLQRCFSRPSSLLLMCARACSHLLFALCFPCFFPLCVHLLLRPYSRVLSLSARVVGASAVDVYVCFGGW